MKLRSVVELGNTYPVDGRRCHMFFGAMTGHEVADLLYTHGDVVGVTYVGHTELDVVEDLRKKRSVSVRVVDNDKGRALIIVWQLADVLDSSLKHAVEQQKV